MAEDLSYEEEREADIKALREILEAIIKDAPEGFRLSWADNAISPERPWGASWVDAYVPEICEKAGIGWLVTIVSSAEMKETLEKNEDRWDEVGMDFDATLEILRGEEYPERVVYRYGDQETEFDWLSFFNYKDDKDFSVEDVNSFDIDFIHAVRPTDAIEIRDGKEWIVRPVWSPKGISSRLSQWVKEIFGFDIEFFWGGEAGLTPSGQEAKETLERIRSGEEETYDIGNGIRASGSAMDFLLEDPDRAATIEEDLIRFKESS